MNGQVPIKKSRREIHVTTEWYFAWRGELGEYDIGVTDKIRIHGSGAAVDHGGDKVLLELQSVSTDAQALIKEVTETSPEYFVKIREQLERNLDDARRALAWASVVLDRNAMQATRMTGKYIRQNPSKPTGIATGVNLILAILLFG